MSAGFDAVLRLAQREAKRHSRSIAIMMDARGNYDLVFADEYPDDPDVIHTVEARPPQYEQIFFPGEVQGSGRNLDLMIEELYAVFGNNKYTGVLH